MSIGGVTGRSEGVGVAADGAQQGGEAVDDGLRWLAAHCRFVTTTLPRGELGVSFAARLLAGLPDACRRRVPDLTGTGPELFAQAVDFGILSEVPSARVMRAVPRLIAERSPLFEARGQRHWTLWVVHALDPAILKKIRRQTPASQLDVCGPAPRRTTERRCRGALLIELERLSAALTSEQAALAEARGREAALASALADKEAALHQVLREAAALAQTQSELPRLREALAQVESARRALAAEVEPLRAQLRREESETKRLRAALEQATAVNRELAQRLESLAGADAVAALAGGLLRSVFRP
jgi:hypothetical protein